MFNYCNIIHQAMNDFCGKAILSALML